MQIVHKRGQHVVGIDHIGSAHDEDQLAPLMQTTTQRLHVDQHAFELDLATSGTADPRSPVVEATGSLILWDALYMVYDALGFAAVDDEAFRALVLGRNHGADQQARHGPCARRARGRLAVGGDVHALFQACH